MKHEERRKKDALNTKKPAETKSFVPYSDEEGRAMKTYAPQSDVEKNIDEAEKYIAAITGKKAEQEKAADVLPKVEKEWNSTEEISLFEPKDIRFQEMPDEAKTETFTVGGGKWEIPDADEAKTEIFDITDNGETIEAQALPEEETKTLPVQEDETVDVSAVQEETPREEEAGAEDALYQGFEYTDESQKRDVLSAMRSRYFLSKVRIAVALVLAAALFALENVAFVKSLFPSQPVYVIADWILALACASLIFDRIGIALKRFFKFRFDVDTITLWALVFSMAATAVAMLFETPEHLVSLYNFPFAVCVFLNALSVFYTMRRDILSFKILSSSYEKQVIELHDADEELPPETVDFSDRLADKGAIFGTLRSADFIEDYFAHKAEDAKAKRSLRLFIPFCLLISVLIFLCSFFVMKHTVAESLGVAYASFMMCAPFSAFVSYYYPLYRSSRRAYAFRSAILCDKTPERYSGAGFVTFCDTDAFPSDQTKVRGIKLYGDRKIDRAIHYAHLVYGALGGPLADVFARADLHSEKTEEVKLREVSKDGVCALIDEKNIVIGTPAYMDEQCFETHFERGDEDYEGNSAKRIFYLACDQIVIAKFYIQYAIAPDFADAARYLGAAGIGISVRTADPCLDDGLFYQLRQDLGRLSVQMSKGCLPEEADASVSAKNAGVVSIGSIKDLIKAMLLCKKIENVKRTNLILQTVSCILGVAVMMLVLFTGQAPAMLSVYPMLYQIFWLLPVYFVAGIYI